MNTNIKKGLIIKKKWLDKILDGSKVWEMRSRPTKITGKIALIEAGTGLIVGEAVLRGSSNVPVPKSPSLIKYHLIEDLSLLDKWKYAWYLSHAKRYDNPIPYQHPRGAVIWVNLHSI